MDVGINKPFKDRIRNGWIKWASENLLANGNLPQPTREQVMEWVNASWALITPEMIRNSFRKCSYRQQNEEDEQQQEEYSEMHIL